MPAPSDVMRHAAEGAIRPLSRPTNHASTRDRWRNSRRRMGQAKAGPSLGALMGALRFAHPTGVSCHCAGSGSEPVGWKSRRFHAGAFRRHASFGGRRDKAAFLPYQPRQRPRAGDVPAGEAGGEQIPAGGRFPIQHFSGAEHTWQGVQHQI